MDTPRAPWGKLNDLRVGTKIALAVAVVAVVAVLTAGVAWSRMGSLDDRVQRLQTSNIARLDALVTLQDGMADMYRGLFLYQGGASAADRTMYQKQVKDAQRAGRTRQSAQEMARMSADLQAVVSRFRV